MDFAGKGDICKVHEPKKEKLHLTPSKLKRICDDVASATKTDDDFTGTECPPCELLETNCLMNTKTPMRSYLRGLYKQSIAYLRVKIFFPAVIDVAIKSFENIDSPSTDKDIIISSLNNLKKEIQDNKCWDKLTYEEAEDFVAWHTFIRGEFSGNWYSTILIHSECYLYRKIYDLFCISKPFSMYDYFETAKRRHLREASLAFGFLVRHLRYVLKAIPEEVTSEQVDEYFTRRRKMFTRFMHLCLWAEKYQKLCLKKGTFDVKESPLIKMSVWKKRVLYDQSFNALVFLGGKRYVRFVDIVLGHTGLELFCNLCLAYFLTAYKLTSHVRFHVKSMPWGVYDVTRQDIDYMMSYLQDFCDETTSLFGRRWKGLFGRGIWSVHQHRFWTLPYDYDCLEERYSDLYDELSESSLIIFQGELHHRKLIGDINWRPDTPFCHALGRFHPAPLVSLRVIEMEIVCGIPLGVKEELDRRCCDWMLSGSFGVILFDAPVCKKEVEPSCVCEGQNPVSFCPTCPTAQKCRENNYLECK